MGLKPRNEAIGRQNIILSCYRILIVSSYNPIQDFQQVFSIVYWENQGLIRFLKLKTASGRNYKKSLLTE